MSQSNFKNLFVLILFMTLFFQSLLSQNNEVELVVLGTIQDAGFPHIGCQRENCQKHFNQDRSPDKVVALGVINKKNSKTYLFEATPDLPFQIHKLLKLNKQSNETMPNGIFLTHAHIGHYTGLMYLGREGFSASEVPVYAMPKMKYFLENNGPWSQLVSQKNIKINSIKNKEAVDLGEGLSVIPFVVPHRDEFSETVGYIIQGPRKSALFIPDIDKWKKWKIDIVEEIKKVDYAFLDATFYNEKELKNRAMEEIPHPFVVESMKLFKNLNPSEKSKIYFIHLNHSNPLVEKDSPETKNVLDNGFRIAREGQVFKL